MIPGRADVAGEKLAVGGQCESPVWSGAQQGGADGGLKLADLAGEDGVPDAPLGSIAGTRPASCTSLDVANAETGS